VSHNEGFINLDFKRDNAERDVHPQIMEEQYDSDSGKVALLLGHLDHTSTVGSLRKPVWAPSQKAATLTYIHSSAPFGHLSFSTPAFHGIAICLQGILQLVKSA
jgi:hypothetical protein